MARKKNFDLKFWLNVFTFAALIGLVIISRHQITDAFKQMADLKLVWLLMMIPLQLINYYAVARLYHDFFASQHEKLRMRTMYAVALELNFVNHVFPSGGVSGFSYLSIRLKREGIPTAKSTLAQLVRFVLTFVSFLILLFAGMIILAFGRHTSPLTILISSTIAFLTLFGTLVLIYIISSEKRIKAFVAFLPRAVNWFVGRFRRGKGIINIDKIDITMAELHKDYLLVSKDWRQLKRPMWWALAINITDIATAYVVYVAFGHLINPGALIIAYAVANFAGLVAILPGGVGIYEGLMTAVLASAGVPKALALSATVVYRIVNMILFLPPGYILYQRMLRRGGEDMQVLSLEAQRASKRRLKEEKANAAKSGKSGGNGKGGSGGGVQSKDGEHHAIPPDFISH